MNLVNSKSYAVGAVLLIVLTLIAVLSILEFKNEALPLLVFAKEMYAPQTSVDDDSTVSFMIVTAQTNGDFISATMQTDNSHKTQLCDKVMQQIYLLANKNPSAESLLLKIDIKTKWDAQIKVEDLDAVRKYPNVEAYVSSEHRSFIGGPLVSAGLIDESSLTVKTPQGGANELVGKTYQNQYTPPGYGVFSYKFVNESQAECLMDGVPYGAICPYTIQGDSVTIVTSCSTGVYKISGNILVGNDGLTLVRLDP